jgi:hypothetical protein
LIALALAVAVEVPFVLVRFAGITDSNQLIATAQQLSERPHTDGLAIAASVAGALFHALLRPLLAAAFVVLYYDARAGVHREGE